MPKALIISIDGEIKDYDGSMEFSEIKEAIDVKWIEGISLHKGIRAYVDEEGLLNGSEDNMFATAVIGALGYPMEHYPAPAICGNVLFFGGTEEGEAGEDLPLSSRQEGIIRDIYENFKAFVNTFEDPK